MTSSDNAARKNFRDHGSPARATYFGRNPRRPAEEGIPVRIERHGRGLTLRKDGVPAGDTVDSFGDTAAFWLAPAPELRAPKMTCHRPGCRRDLNEHHSSDRLPGGYCDTDEGREYAQLLTWNARHSLVELTADRIIAARGRDHDQALKVNSVLGAPARSPEVSAAWIAADLDERERLIDQAHTDARDEYRRRTQNWPPLWIKPRTSCW